MPPMAENLERDFALKESARCAASSQFPEKTGAIAADFAAQQITRDFPSKRKIKHGNCSLSSMVCVNAAILQISESVVPVSITSMGKSEVLFALVAMWLSVICEIIRKWR